MEWTRGTVAMIESGRRRVTLEEFLALPIILERAGVRDAELADLVGSDGLAQLSPRAGVGFGTAVSAQTLQAVLAGRAKALGEAGVHTPPGLDTPEMRDARRLWRQLRGGRLDLARLSGVVLASQGGPEVHAARVLGTSPLAVAMAAEHAWKRSLTAERDARVDQRMGLDDYAAGVDRADRHGLAHPVAIRTVQAHRGHVTRELIEELRPTVKAAVSKRKGKGDK